ncbi:MAG: exodeoxyribonuclease VII large subunit, partial [Clostridiales bacterium]|nr:exodeoxyribonuclease VII large subunit [Clostridiales bacterium]
MEQTIFTVGQVNQYLKAKLDGDRLLSAIAVRGEISNYKRYPSGHHYFSLKDGEGALKCVLFRSSAPRLRFQPEHGMKVVVRGRIT